MDSIRYRVLFTVVLVLFCALLAFDYLGEQRFVAFAYEIHEEILLPFEKKVEEVTVGILPHDETKLESRYEFNPEGTIGIGSYLPDLNASRFQVVMDHEALIEHKLQYLLMFRAWGDSDSHFPTEYVQHMRDLELVPIITWEPWERDFENPTAIQAQYSLESIVSGRHDKYIKQWAKDAKAADFLVIIRFAHEQSTAPDLRAWYPWQGKPSTFVAAYRRIVTLFREEGANNVRFMWSPVSFWPDSTLQYYPGDKYMDYVGLTVLNHGAAAGQEDDRWKRCDELLTDQYNVIKSVDKPYILVEFASSERGGSKTRWWRDCFDRLDQIKSLVGIVTLETERDIVYPRVRWGVDTSDESARVFKEEISSPKFK
jgi:hypothetical protein